MPNQKPQVIILMGRSGCGKGTQAKFLQDEFKFKHVNSGDLIRAKMKEKNFFGQKLKKVINRGGLAPTFLISQLWTEKIIEIKIKSDLKGLIIDGSPRTLIEARLMNEIFDWVDWKKIKVVLLDISDREAFNRLTKRRICQKCGRLIPWVGQFKDLKKCDKCGGQLITRSDDKPEAIRSRLDFYNKEVEPAIDYYRKQDRLIKINGQQSIENVYQEIKKNLQLKIVS
jgi:adenylate kinase